MRVRTSAHTSNLGIVIPLYRSPSLVKALERNLLERAAELAECNSTVLFINDSPDDEELEKNLQQAVLTLSPLLDVKVLRNESNQGFVRSANRGLQWCLENDADALLLNSDALLADGCVSELRRVSSIDPMIGVVCPRSNNATLCSLPFQWSSKRLPFDEALAAFKQLGAYLPEWQFVPTGVGFCMYIRHTIVSDFGLLDEIYSPGYHEENDFCCRINRCGFRVALANRAFCYHDESVSFGSKKKLELNLRNEKILNERYPEYQRAVGTYFSSPEFRFEQTISSLVPDKDGPPRLLIDLSHFRKAFNGTFEYGKKIARALADMSPRLFNITLMCNSEEASFHDLAIEFKGIRIIPTTSDETFDLALKPAQPFNLAEIELLSNRSPLNFYIMLDSIAFDCAYICSKELSAVWRLTAQYSDGLIFISQFSQDQFTRRFTPSTHTTLLSALCSTEESDYLSKSHLSASRVVEPYILVVGNHYEHKFINPTVKALIEDGENIPIRVLGSCDVKSSRVQITQSGQLSQDAVERLYADAKFIIFPSLYEGFGFPILHGLAYDKVVCARSSALNEEIAKTWNGGGSLVLYRDTKELISIVKQICSSGIEEACQTRQNVYRGCADRKHSWTNVAEHVGTFLLDSYRRSPVSPLTRPRIEAIRGVLDASCVKDIQESLEDTQKSLEQARTAEKTVNEELVRIKADLARQINLFTAVTTSPSFKIGKALTRMMNLIPGTRSAYRYINRS
jgi:GT2 family glycosyltransferase